MRDHEVELLVGAISGDIFELFKKSYPVDKSFYRIEPSIVVNAVENARVDIERVAKFHSRTGANIYKKVSYVGNWLADLRPIQVVKSFPLNLDNSIHLNVANMNSNFATYFIETILSGHGVKPFSSKLRRDIRYSLEYRERFHPDCLSMLLEHIAV